MPPRLCSIQGCLNMHDSRGLCTKHWSRWKKSGDPNIVAIIVGDDEKRFWSHVDKTGSCWFWTAYRKPTGYGTFSYKGKPVRAHRFSFFLAKGKWPELDVLHKCDNAACVNPGHLREGTHQENMQEMVDRARANPNGKGNKKWTNQLNIH